MKHCEGWLTPLAGTLPERSSSTTRPRSSCSAAEAGVARGKQAASRHTEPDLLYLDLRSSEWSTDIQEPEQGRDPDHEVEFRSGLVKLSLVFVITN